MVESEVDVEIASFDNLPATVTSNSGWLMLRNGLSMIFYFSFVLYIIFRSNSIIKSLKS
jgi:hypothetical protein